MTDLEKYVLARWCYSVGKPIISDAEYTILHNYISASQPNNPYVKRSWSSDPCPAALLRKYKMEEYITAVIVTDKTESIPSLNTFYEIKQAYGSLESPVSVSYKHDGWNIQASYYNGQLIHIQTRGRVSDAMVVTPLMEKLPKQIPMQGKVTVVMECTVSFENFRYVKAKYGNASIRGAVNTLLANPEDVHLLDLHAFKIHGPQAVVDDFKTLTAWGFKTPMYTHVDNYEDLLSTIRKYSEFKKQYPSPTDGLVVAGDMTRAVRVLEWEEPIYKSYVTGYEEGYGPHNISVGLMIRPIKLSNSTQTRVPATNLKRVIEMNLQIGSPVAFRFVSSSIADIDEEATKLLHKQYENCWDIYRGIIDSDEMLKLEQESDNELS